MATFAIVLTLGVAASTTAAATTTWIDSWGASFLPTLVNGSVQSTSTFKNQTLRLIVNTKLGGTGARVKLTNTFSTVPLHIGAAHIALRSSGGTITASSDRALTFGGASSATVAPGAELWSDPVTLTIGQHVDVAISVYLPDAQFKPTNFHPTGLHTSYLSKTGNYVASTTMPAPSFGQASTTTQVLIAGGTAGHGAGDGEGRRRARRLDHRRRLRLEQRQRRLAVRPLQAPARTRRTGRP